MVEVSVVIPAHNEEGNLEKLAEELQQGFKDAQYSYEIILVNDNSTDQTPYIADQLAKKYKNIRAVHRSPPAGFGRAIKDGLRAAKGKIIVITMADLSDDARDVRSLAEKAREGYDVVYGSRFLPESTIQGYPFPKMLANRLFNFLVRLLFLLPEKDITNAFKAYHRRVIDAIGIDNMHSNSFDICIELPLRAKFLGFSDIEVAVRWYGRRTGFSKLSLTRTGPLYGIRLIHMLLLRLGMVK